MNNTERGLLNDIIENKDNDEPRLIYADWLEDQATKDDDDYMKYAEFIRLQIELHPYEECTRKFMWGEYRTTPHNEDDRPPDDEYKHPDDCYGCNRLKSIEERLKYLCVWMYEKPIPIFDQHRQKSFYVVRCFFNTMPNLDSGDLSRFTYIVYSRGFVSEVYCNHEIMKSTIIKAMEEYPIDFYLTNKRQAGAYTTWKTLTKRTTEWRWYNKSYLDVARADTADNRSDELLVGLFNRLKSHHELTTSAQGGRTFPYIKCYYSLRDAQIAYTNAALEEAKWSEEMRLPCII